LRDAALALWEEKLSRLSVSEATHSAFSYIFGRFASKNAEFVPQVFPNQSA
jgi:hypothetical protein